MCTILKRGGAKKMGKDRQEKKLKASKDVGPDRDQALHYPGSTKLAGPNEARGLNDSKYD